MPNKHVNRINYHVRLTDLTRDVIEGLSEEPSATSLPLTAVQNLMALEFLLEEGGVYSMFGDICCTFIPNNTAPDGSVTRALEGAVFPDVAMPLMANAPPADEDDFELMSVLCL